MSFDEKTLDIAYSAEWSEAWEPFYISRRNIPLYDERFKDFGFDRRQQICELYISGFEFKVFDNAFLVHHEWKTINDMTVGYLN